MEKAAEKKATINITAKTAENFAKVQEGLDKLDPMVRDQITSAEYDKHFGIRCKLFENKFYGREINLDIYLPREIKLINNNLTKIDVHFNNGYLFEIEIPKGTPVKFILLD